MSKVEVVDFKEIESLIFRVEHALEHDLALDAEDMRLILNAIHTLVSLQSKLEEKDMTLLKLKKLLGMITQSERRNGSGGRKNNTKSNKSSNKNNQSSIPAPTKEHKIVDLKRGDPCPVCPSGRLGKKAPLVFIRVTGSCEYQSEKHIVNRLVCNLCDHVVTAEVPKEVTQDGDLGQKYGYSARSMMAIHKNFSGSPYFHQETLNNMFGQSITASTIFDQCEYVANDTQPAYFELKRLAANAVLFHIDDTSNRILDQKPEKRKKRNGKGTVERKGVYTSGLIAVLGDGKMIYLYETSLGHAGELIDDILRKRDTSLPPPILMCDALSRNLPSGSIKYYLSFCNSHARRGFYDLTSLFPEVEKVLDWYEKIWINDSNCKNVNYDDAQRLSYHEEHSLPVMQSIKQWCQSYMDSDQSEHHGNLGKACAYFLNHFEELVMFCKMPGAPIDNNLMEEGLKVPIRTRKSSFFYKTKNGADVSNRLTTLICTAHRNNVNPFHYLNALQRNQEDLKSNPDSWLPWTIEESYLKA